MFGKQGRNGEEEKKKREASFHGKRYLKLTYYLLFQSLEQTWWKSKHSCFFP
jgi:hypothetical protein